MRFFLVIVFIICSTAITWVSSSSLSGCRETFPEYIEENPDCNYTVLPVLDLTIDCANGILRWKESTKNSTLPSWTDEKADLEIYRSCTNFSSNVTYEENIYLSYIYLVDSNSINVVVPEGLLCTFGTCNSFVFYPCWILNEQVVSCPSPPPLSSESNSATTCISCNSLSFTPSLDSSIPAVILSTSTTSTVFNSTTHDKSSISLPFEPSGLPYSENTSVTSAIGSDTDVPLPSNASNSSADVSLSMIIVISVCLTAIMIFIVTSLFIMVSHKYARDSNHNNNKSGSSDNVTPDNDFQEVTSVVYIEGLLKGLGTDNKSNSGSTFTVYEEPIPFKAPAPNNKIQLKYHQAKARSNTYVFTTNAYNPHDGGIRFVKPQGGSITSSSDEDVSYFDVSASSVSAGTITDQSIGGCNCGRPTNIDDYMKKV